jgi:two-component system OmpR family response regulator/two-component system copper resistance phosphate regulon response regulator CusR
MHVLVIEDDRTIGKALERGLAEAGHECTWVKNGRRGLEEALSCHADVVILDLLLPELPGLELLRRLRADGVRTPVLLLTALGSVEERVAGLNAGADDYLVKPFAFPELLARIEAVRRRMADRPAAIVHAGPMTLDLATRRVNRAGQDVDLTPTEFSILELLLRYAGQVVTRKMLCEHVWDADWEGLTNVIEVHIKRLRDKLAAAGDPDLIRTVRGRGYAVRALSEDGKPLTDARVQKVG